MVYVALKLLITLLRQSVSAAVEVIVCVDMISGRLAVTLLCVCVCVDLIMRLFDVLVIVITFITFKECKLPKLTVM